MLQSSSAQEENWDMSGRYVELLLQIWLMINYNVILTTVCNEWTQWYMAVKASLIVLWVIWNSLCCSPWECFLKDYISIINNDTKKTKQLQKKKKKKLISPFQKSEKEQQQQKLGKMSFSHKICLQQHRRCNQDWWLESFNISQICK